MALVSCNSTKIIVGDLVYFTLDGDANVSAIGLVTYIKRILQGDPDNLIVYHVYWPDQKVTVKYKRYMINKIC